MDTAAQENDLDASIAAEIATEETPVITEAETVETKAQETTNEIEAEPAPAEEIEAQEEPDGFQKRINKITKEKHDARRQAEAMQVELDALKAAQQPEQAPADGKAPTLESCDYDDEKYQEALINHGIDKRMQARDQQQALKRQQQERQAVTQKFNDKAADYTAKTPDYVEAVSALPLMPAATQAAIMELDNGPQVAYYLGKHLDIADQVASLPPMQAAMKLGEIRANLANKKPTNKPSAAPEPVQTLTSGSSQSKDIGEMSMDEIYNL